jgi:hypothetical protein
MNEEFYLKHKDIEWEIPVMPRDGSINETDGKAVMSWILNEMQQGRLGWLALNLMTIKPAGYTPLAWQHESRTETESLLEGNHYKEVSKGVHEYEAKDKKGWKPWEYFPAPTMSQFWVGGDFPCTRLTTGRYERIEPNSSTEPLNPNINENTDIVKPELYAFPILMSLIAPGSKCHVVVEDFGTLKLHEGYMYLINPWRKRMLTNVSETESATQFHGQVLLGKEVVPFSDVITRSYFQEIGHMQR